MLALRGLLGIDELLRGEGRHAAGGGRVPWGRLALLVVLGGGLYGAVMGSYGIGPSIFSGWRGQQALYSALKVPLLLAVSTLVCLPNFYVVNLLLGLGADFAAACRAILSAQATLAIVLGALAPVTAVAYLSSDSYHFAKLWNGAMFALASWGAQQTLARHYRPLVARAPQHRVALRAWPVLYVFVALQLAYVLRPFVGNPRLPSQFLRDPWWGNVYVDVWWAIRGVLGS